MSLTQRVLQFIKTRHAKTIGVVFLVFFIIFSITGFFILPPYVKSIAVEKLSKQLGRPVAIRSVSLNPYTLSVTINGLVVKEPDLKQTFFSIDSLYVNAAIMSLFKGGPVLKEIRVEKPYIHVVRTEANTYNFSDIIDRSQNTARPEAPSKPIRFSLNNIRVVNGSVDFIDRPVGKVHTVRALTVAIPFISDMPADVDIFEKPMFKANVNGSDFTFGGDAKPFSTSLETLVNVNLKDLDIPFYAAYLPVKPRANIRSGRLDIRMGVSYRRYKDRSPALTISGDIVLKKLAVTDLRNRPVVSFDALKVSIASAEPFEKRFDFSNIILESPNLALERDRRGALSILGLMPGHSAPVRKVSAPETSPAAAGASSVEAGKIEVRKGTFAFSDAGVARPFSTTLRDIELKVLHFSTLKDKRAAFSASLMSESGEKVQADGDIGMDPIFYDGKFSVTSVLLKKYMPYLAKQVRFDITDGKLDLVANVSYHARGDKPVMLISPLEASLRDLRAVKRGEREDFLKIAAFSIKDTLIDLTERKVDIGVMSTEKGFFVLRKNKDGSLNIANLMTPAPAPTGKAGPWTFKVRSLNTENYIARVEDLSLAEPFSLDIDRITVKGKGLSTVKNARGTASFSCRVAKKGTVKASGNILLEPLKTALSINIKDLPIAPLQPYVDEKASVLITGGGITAGGKITAGMTKKEGLKAAFKGRVWINNFATADAGSSQDLLKWDTFYMGEMDIRYAPLFVDINDISLTNFYSRIIVNADRTINLQEVFKPAAAPQQQQSGAQPQAAQSTEQPAAAEQKPAPKKMIRISRITLQGGTIDLSDHSVNPTFHSKLSEIGGSVSGLSSEENKFGEVDLRGKYDGYAPLDITGKVNPLRDDLYVDLKFNFSDMDLTPVSPYSGRYAGYTIQEGKLSFQLQYLIVKNKLDAKNNIFIDQFTFGERVESPQATRLPVRLAVALLKDRNGKINLDIPVSGDIHDPKFSISSVVWKIIKNILVKAATSPFALLSAIFGGGEQLNYVEFDYGVSTLPDSSQKKLDIVAKALYERPSLKMDIEGHADPERDREGLKQYLLARKVKAEKLKELAKKGMAVPSLDAVTVTDKEYPEYLKRAYKKEKFPKPRNFIGMAKDLPVPEMEKLMLANTKVTEEELRALASQRAMAVKDYILKSKQVDPGRIFFVEAKSLEPEKKEQGKKSRVDLVLK